MRIVRADLLRHVCKEPLADVRSLYLQGRGVEQMQGLESCPNVTSLDISCNSLTALDEKCFQQCRELWVIDASHNRLEHIDGLSSFLAIGYLNLSNNHDLSLDSLRPLARAHLLELYMDTSKYVPEFDRCAILRAVPNVWVLDGEYVTVRERLLAEGCDHSDTRNDSQRPWATVDDFCAAAQEAAHEFDERTSPGSTNEGQHCHDENRGGQKTRAKRADVLSSSHPEYRDMYQQGRLAREFFEDVVWKLPSRSQAADPVRLRTLLERYDNRVAITNRSAWLSSFTSTHGVATTSPIGGVDYCGSQSTSVLRRSPAASCPLPLSHTGFLRSLSLKLKLDVTTLLAVRAAFRDTIPQQVLAEALMVLLIPHARVPEGIHVDLSRVPPFVCTALVQALREDILRDVDKVSAPQCRSPSTPPVLSEAQLELLAALPPVVTGIGNAFEDWETSQNVNEPTEGNKGSTGLNFSRIAKIGEVQTPVVQPVVGLGESYAMEGLVGPKRVRGVSGEDKEELPRVGFSAGGADLGSEELNRTTLRRDIESPVFAPSQTQSEADERSINTEENMGGSVLGRVLKERSSLLSAETPADVDDGETAAAAEAAAVPSTALRGSDRGTTRNTLKEGFGVTRLCRRVVILLTRSPACPDLIERQTGASNQRAYDQMEPLLERAGMSYRDLHPSSDQVTRSSARHGKGNTLNQDTLGDISEESDDSIASSVSGQLDSFEACDKRNSPVMDQRLTKIEESTEAAQCNNQIRKPRLGERVQVLVDTWSIIVSTCPKTASVTVAPYQGMGSPICLRECQLDSQDLCYDPRGWWTHVHTLAQCSYTTPPPPQGHLEQIRLHRPHRGISASGLQSGSGTLNVPLSLVHGLENIIPDDLQKADGRCGDATASAISAAHSVGTRAIPSRTTHQSSAQPKGDTSCGVETDQRYTGDGRCCAASALDVFSAEGSWDPMFVVAPSKLVGLQNAAAVRTRGLKRARQVAWHRIDGPEVYVAPKPMMPRCWKDPPPSHQALDRPALFASVPIPGLHPPPWTFFDAATRCPSARSSLSAIGSLRSRPGVLSRSSSVPADPRLSGEEVMASDRWYSWLELQREMGSLKSENLLGLPWSSRKRGGGFTNVLRMQGSANTFTTKSSSFVSKDSNGHRQAESQALANTLSSKLDRPVSPWRRDPEPKAEPKESVAHGRPAEKSTVFELTQVSTNTETDGDTRPMTANADHMADGTVAMADECREQTLPIASQNVDATASAPALSMRNNTQQRGRRRKRRLASPENPSVTWKPNVHKGLEWFPVAGRTVFRVDPSNVAAATTNNAAGASAYGSSRYSPHREKAGSDQIPHEIEANTNGGPSAQARAVCDARVEGDEHTSTPASEEETTAKPIPFATTSAIERPQSKISGIENATLLKSPEAHNPEVNVIEVIVGGVRPDNHREYLHDSIARSEDLSRRSEPNGCRLRIFPDSHSDPVRSSNRPEVGTENERPWDARSLVSPNSADTAHRGRGVAGSIEGSIGPRIRSDRKPPDKLLVGVSLEAGISSVSRRGRRSLYDRMSSHVGSRRRSPSKKDVRAIYSSHGSRSLGVPGARGIELIQILGRLPPCDSGSRSSNGKQYNEIIKHRRTSSSSGLKPKPNGHVLSVLPKRPTTSTTRNGRLASPLAVNVTGSREERGKHGPPPSEAASGDLECLSISSGSYCGWSAGGRH